MRTFLIVIDSFGVGELPDAYKYGDVGSNTFLNIVHKTGVQLNNLAKLGLYDIDGINIPHKNKVVGCYGKMSEYANAKDTTAGHYEIAGILNKRPYPVYPNGFPKKVMDKLIKACGVEFLGNCVASGTKIIEELGAEHMATGKPIIYTSQDSVLQIACHVDVVPLKRLYEICEIARSVMKGKHSVGRVIARPFAGKLGKLYRTGDRKDYALLPPKRSMLEDFKDYGYDVIGVGKISDVFCGVGITEDNHTKNNQDSLIKTMDLTTRDFNGLAFINLVDTDMLYGHRNDVKGYAGALKEIDGYIPQIMHNLKEDDLLIITADHGCDPTTPSTDHSREYVPLLIYGKKLKRSINLHTVEGFNNIAISLLDYYGIKKSKKSLFNTIK